MRKSAGLKLAEYQRSEYVETVAIGTTIEDVKEPAYWAAEAHLLKRGSHIEVWANDGTWWAELMVLAVQPFAARVHVLRHVQFDRKTTPDAPVEVPAGYELQHRGKNGWHVLRLSDRAMLTEKIDPPMQTKAEASLWLDRFLRSIAA